MLKGDVVTGLMHTRDCNINSIYRLYMLTCTHAHYNNH